LSGGDLANGTGHEKLARFLTARNQYSPTRRAAKPLAFLPRNNELSVFCVADLPYSEIVPLGRHLNLPAERRIHGHATLASRSVADTGLTVDRDDRPLRHANVTGWPDEKDKRLAIAQELAAASALYLHRGE